MFKDKQFAGDDLSCLGDHCGSRTQHRSGYCTSCRMKECQKCHVEFISDTGAQDPKAFCPKCRRLKPQREL